MQILNHNSPIVNEMVFYGHRAIILIIWNTEQYNINNAIKNCKRKNLLILKLIMLQQQTRISRMIPFLRQVKSRQDDKTSIQIEIS